MHMQAPESVNFRFAELITFLLESDEKLYKPPVSDFAITLPEKEFKFADTVFAELSTGYLRFPTIFLAACS